MSKAIVLFSYPESPFGKKLELVLLFKQLPYSICTTTRIPPRPALLALGINYRRIPVLSIGNEVYTDTSIAVLALEELFPENSLKGRNWGLQTSASFFWTDRQMFKNASGLLDWESLPQEFIIDRSAYVGGKIDPKKMAAMRPMIMSTMRSHVVSFSLHCPLLRLLIPIRSHKQALIEAQLESRTSSSNFVLDTSTVTYLDISLYFILAWIISFKTAPELLTSSESPLVTRWMDSMKSAIAHAKTLAPGGGKIPRISNEEAAKIIYSYKPNESQAKIDSNEPLVVAGWLKLGGEAEVIPDDTGKVGTRGILIAMNRDRSVIEVKGDSGKTCRVIAPKLGFNVSMVKK